MVINKSAFAALATDASAEVNGIEVLFELGAIEIGITIARAGGKNDGFQKKSEQLTRPFRRTNVEIEQLPIAKQEEITRVLYADAIILGWRTYVTENGERKCFADVLFDDDGSEIPFTRDNVISVLKRIPDLLLFIVREATKYQNFRRAVRESEAGN